jgi:hypothetical protein
VGISKTSFQKGHAKKGGRAPGVQNQTTRSLKEALLLAAIKAGNGDLTEYLYRQAIENPGHFLGLLGKLIPLQMEGDLTHTFQITRVERVIIDPDNPDREEIIDAITH